MRSLSSSELLDLWEVHLGEPIEVTVTGLLAAAMPELEVGGVELLPIGRRDAALLDLRDRTFGPQLAATSICTACGERAEIAFTTDDVRIRPPDEPGLTIRDGTYEITFRLPTTADLLSAEASGGVDDLRRALVRSCVTGARKGSFEVDPVGLPDEVVDDIEAAMAVADPQADVQLTLACPACSEPSRVTFDIATFFVDEIETWARKTLHEVASLASSFGWCEADVLALAPQRRQYYLASVGA